MSTLLDSLAERLQDCAKHNRHSEVPPVAILWTDPDALWKDLVPLVGKVVPVLELGEYAPEQRRGPVSWIKTALAGKFPEVTLTPGVPVIYLPNVAASQLRETRDCPVGLQPLVELIYRGVVWYQKNGRDVTPFTLLSSKEFLGLTLAKDAQTAALLPSALKLLFAKDLEEVRNEHIDTSYLHDLLQPDLARSVLAWLNRPSVWKAENLSGWGAFVAGVKSKSKFDIERDGHLVAIEKLAERKGVWGEWWSRFEENPQAYPGVLAALEQLPSDGFASGVSYPIVNLNREDALSHLLGGMVQNRQKPSATEWKSLEADWQERSRWLWYRLGMSPILDLLRKILDLHDAIASAGRATDWISWYLTSGWKVDAAALELGNVPAQVQTLAQDWVRLLYVPWLEQTATAFQSHVRESGLPAPQRGQVPAIGEIQVFIDGLRMDLAHRLCAEIERMGHAAKMDAAWTTSPSVTATGKAMISPLAAQLAGSESPEGFVPRFGVEGALFATASMKNRLAQAGIQCEGAPEEFDAKNRAWTEIGDLDSDGHAQGWRLSAKLGLNLESIAYKISLLVNAGWNRIRIVTDHGWLLVPGGLPSVALPVGGTDERWGRCAVLKAGANAGLLELPWSWSGAVSVAYPPGIACFKSGEDYAHGGLSPQEMIVPQIVIEVGAAEVLADSPKLEEVRWTRLKCRVTLSRIPDGAVLDLRQRPADRTSSLLTSPKALSKGDEVVSIFVEDDEREATAAYVVLEVNGMLVDQRNTIVGDANANG